MLDFAHHSHPVLVPSPGKALVAPKPPGIQWRRWQMETDRDLANAVKLTVSAIKT